MNFIDRLIEEVRSRPFLWNYNLEEYRDLHAKEAAWKEIGVLLGKSKNEIKAEWKKLRDRHRQAMHRKKLRAEQAAHRAKPWIYEKQMEFIAATKSYDPSDVNIPSVELNDSERDADGEAINFLPDEFNTLDEGEEDVPGPSVLQEPRECVHQPMNVDRMLQFLNEQQNKRICPEPDDLDLFFASACKSTRRLPRFLQSRVKMEILQAISRAEEDECSSQSQMRLNTGHQSILSPSSSSCDTTPSLAFPEKSDRNDI